MAFSQVNLYQFSVLEIATSIPALVITGFTVLFVIYRLGFCRSSQSQRTNHVVILPNSSPNSRPMPPNINKAEEFSNCTSPGCVRCRNYRNLTDNLEQKLSDYKCRTSSTTETSESPTSFSKRNQQPGLERLTNSIEMVSLTSAVSTLNKSPSEEPKQYPTVFKLYNLTAKPWYDRNDMFKNNIKMLEDSFTTIWNEFSLVYEGFLSGNNQGWFSNTVPTGMWSVFHLYNQGVRVDSNCSKCPETARILETMDSFMSSVAFGNATFSVLQAGTWISAHYGPCNLRVRCHLGVYFWFSEVSLSLKALFICSGFSQ